MTKYVHGTDTEEQERLRRLNELTNPPFIAFLDPKPYELILEVGSGLGILAGEVARKTSDGRVIGVEYSEKQLAKAVATIDNLALVQGDAHSLPFADNMFDAVYCRYLLEHLDDPARALKEMYRALKPGGRVCIQENDIAVFHLWPECPTWTVLWQSFGRLQGKLGGDAHVGRKLHSLLQAAGFSAIELSIQPELHYAGTRYFELWVTNALLILEASFDDLVSHRYARPEKLAAVRSEIKRFVSLPDAATYFYWNRARAAKKPG